MKTILSAFFASTTLLAPTFQAIRLRTAPVQTYYMPLPERDLLQTLQTANHEVDGEMITIISIAVARNNTVIWYDHWEDGYEADVTNAIQNSTLVIGDGDVTNGALPGISYDADDFLAAGDSIILENNVPVDGSRFTVKFDAKDKISTSLPVAVTRAAYPEFPGSLFAGAVEVQDTDNWGTIFEIPVGPSTESRMSTHAFELTEVYILAQTDNTNVTIADGSILVLNQGESAKFTADQGDLISSTSPIQADMLVADTDSKWELRWYSLLPRDDWSSEYYTPVGTASKGETVAWLYNPNNEDIMVNSNVGGPYIIPSKATIRSDPIRENHGARFVSGHDIKFFGIVQVDADWRPDGESGQEFDWGHPLIPSDQLTHQALIGLGYGCTSNNCMDEKSKSVIFVMPVENATICIDFDNDGYSEPRDTSHTLEELEAKRVADDGIGGDTDMSGALIYGIRDGTCENPGTPVDIAVAWGQDPSTVYDSNDQFTSLDLGTVVLPFPIIEASKSVVHKDVVCAGDILYYTISVQNTGKAKISAGSFLVRDFVPEGTSYVEGTTTYDSGFGPVPIKDDSTGSTFPLDDDGLPLQALLEPQTPHRISFEVVIRPISQLKSGTTKIISQGEIYPNGNPLSPEDTFATATQLSFHPSITIENQATAGPNGYCSLAVDHLQLPPFADVTYCFTITNDGDTYITAIKVFNGVLEGRGGDFTGGVPKILAPGESFVLTLGDNIKRDFFLKNWAIVKAFPSYVDGVTIEDVGSVASADDSSVQIVTSSPTGKPTNEPRQPSEHPSATPSAHPFATPSDTPSSSPSLVPSWLPSSTPSNEPSLAPSRVPTYGPSEAPSLVLSEMPSFSPTEVLTESTSTPSQNLSSAPSIALSPRPSFTLSTPPSSDPSESPSLPTSDSSSFAPTEGSSLANDMPSSPASLLPSRLPSSLLPSVLPSLSSSPTGLLESSSAIPSSGPTVMPSDFFSPGPTEGPSSLDTEIPSSLFPSSALSELPSSVSSAHPSDDTSVPSAQSDSSPNPTVGPSPVDTDMPSSAVPSSALSELPSSASSPSPSNTSSSLLSLTPSQEPSGIPSFVKSTGPSFPPTQGPESVVTEIPSSEPSKLSSSAPSASPSTVPSGNLSTMPSESPSTMPFESASSEPSEGPSATPTEPLSSAPSAAPSLTPSTSLTMPPTNRPTCAYADVNVENTVYAGHDGGASCPGSGILTDFEQASLTYCFVVTNSGAFPLTNVTLGNSDLLLLRHFRGNIEDVIPDVLSPQQSFTVYVEDILVKESTNTATVAANAINKDGSLPPPRFREVADFDTSTVQIISSCNVEVDVTCNAAVVNPSLKTSATKACTRCPTAITFKYLGGGCDQRTHDQFGAFKCTDSIHGPPTKFGSANITVANRSGRIVYFSNTVSIGQSFQVFGPRDRQFGVFTRVKIEVEGRKLQSFIFRTSCSGDLFLNDIFGALQVVGFSNHEQGVVSAARVDTSVEMIPCHDIEAPDSLSCYKRPTAMSFKYVGGGCIETTNQQYDRLSCIDGDGGAPTTGKVNIQVLSTPGGSKSSDQITKYFHGDVNVGERFALDIGSQGVSSRVRVVIREKKGNKVVQLMIFQASCAKPLAIFDQFGGLQLISFANDAQGIVSGEIDATYTYTAGNLADVSHIGLSVEHDGVPSATLQTGGSFISGENFVVKERRTILLTNRSYVSTTTATVTGTPYQTANSCKASRSLSVPIPSIPTTTETSDGICEDRPWAMSMKYLGGDCSQTTNTQFGVYKCTTNDPVAITKNERVTITVTDKDDAITYFDGSVKLGETFDLETNASRMASNIKFVVEKNHEVLQTAMFHTSCSKDLFVGDIFGSLQLLSFVNNRQGNVTMIFGNI